jgi:hypothetical protein
VLASLGAVVGGAGGILLWRAVAKFDEVRPTCHPCTAGSFSGWQAATSASYALISVGGAALAAGALWGIIGARRARRTAFAPRLAWAGGWIEF